MTTAAERSAALLRQLDAKRQHPEHHTTKGNDPMSNSRQVAVARGLEAAQKAIHAIANNEDDRALAILNAQSYESTLWTSAILLGCLRQMASVLAAGDPKETRRLLHAGADGAGDDTSVTQAEVIVSDAFNRLTGA